MLGIKVVRTLSFTQQNMFKMISELLEKVLENKGQTYYKTYHYIGQLIWSMNSSLQTREQSYWTKLHFDLLDVFEAVTLKAFQSSTTS